MSEAANQSKPEAKGIVNLAKIPAAEICERARIEKEGRSLLEDDMSVEAFLAALEAEGEQYAAIRVLAQALDPRRAVRWALDCCRQHVSDMSTEEREVFPAVEMWLRDPSDVGRRALGAMGEKVGLDRPPGCVAMAVFFAEGSMAPEDLEEVPPPEGSCGQVASGAILLAAVEEHPEEALEKAKKYLARGREVAVEDIAPEISAPEPEA